MKLATLETLELLAIASFEFVVVDLEHSPLTLETAYTLCFGAQHLGMTALAHPYADLASGQHPAP